MPMLTKPAFGPRVALAYVTFGSLLCVWTLVWYFTRDTEPSRTGWFWLSGLFLTGSTFIFLGVVLGRLGRAARAAELPPEDAIRKEAAIQQTAAANAVPMMPPATNAVPAVPAAPAATIIPAAPPAVPAPAQ